MISKRRKAMKTKQDSSSVWYNRNSGALLLALVSFAAAFVLGLRAIDTGSLQQYFMTALLLAAGCNRSAHVALGSRRAKTRDAA